MLEGSLIESAGRRETRKPATVLVSVVVHVVLVTLLVIVPLFQTYAFDALTPAFSPPLPPMPKVTDVHFVAVPQNVRPTTATIIDTFQSPVVIPQDIARVIDVPVISEGPAMPLLPRGGTSVSPGFVQPFAIPEVAPPLKPVEPPPISVAPPQAPVRIRGGVQQANLIHQVLPVYPALARSARIEGVVLLEATISKEGSIENLRVVSGHALLTQSALDAVAQWRYRPTLLNGEPVEVITTVTVTFRLQ